MTVAEPVAELPSSTLYTWVMWMEEYWSQPCRYHARPSPCCSKLACASVVRRAQAASGSPGRKSKYSGLRLVDCEGDHQAGHDDRAGPQGDGADLAAVTAVGGLRRRGRQATLVRSSATQTPNTTTIAAPTMIVITVANGRSRGGAGTPWARPSVVLPESGGVSPGGTPPPATRPGVRSGSGSGVVIPPGYPLVRPRAAPDLELFPSCSRDP